MGAEGDGLSTLTALTRSLERLVPEPIRQHRRTPGQLFWVKVDRGHPMDCWRWLGSYYPTGYGFTKIDGDNDYAHRLAWLVAGRTLIPGMVIMHTCDNRACCNPAHLVRGTQKENIHDAIRKRRFTQHIYQRLRLPSKSHRPSEERRALQREFERRRCFNDLAPADRQ